MNTMTPLTAEEIATLSAEVDAQLHELERTSIAVHKGTKEKTPPTQQYQAIETATGEPANTFLQKFKRAAYNDLCKSGGMLYEQWHTYGDLSNEKTLKIFSSVLVLMGISGAALHTVIVAVTVIVLHLGIKAICEETVSNA